MTYDAGKADASNGRQFGTMATNKSSPSELYKMGWASGNIQMEEREHTKRVANFLKPRKQRRMESEKYGY